MRGRAEEVGAWFRVLPCLHKILHSPKNLADAITTSIVNLQYSYDKITPKITDWISRTEGKMSSGTRMANCMRRTSTIS